MMKATELATKCKDVALNYRTTYVWGGLGQPITKAYIDNAVRQYKDNRQFEAAARKLIGKGAFAFDCSGLIKSLLYGWTRRRIEEPRRRGVCFQWCA